MLPARKDSLVPDSRSDLGYIGQVVSAALADAGNDWNEVVREYEDERNYLSISVAKRPGDDVPTVNIEFGVQDGRERHATGGMVARWLRDAGRIEGLEIVLIDGKPSDITPFAERLAGYVKLPVTVRDTAVQDAD